MSSRSKHYVRLPCFLFKVSNGSTSRTKLRTQQSTGPVVVLVNVIRTVSLAHVSTDIRKRLLRTRCVCAMAPKTRPWRNGHKRTPPWLKNQVPGSTEVSWAALSR